MKKLFIASMVAVFSLSMLAPALANENATTTVSSSLKDKLENFVKRVEKKVKYVRRAVVLRGDLVSYASTSIPTTLTVKIDSVTPKKNKNWTGAYPAVSSTLTINLDSKTNMVRKYWGKSSLDEMTPGDKVYLVVKTNEDGSVTATLIKDESIHAALNIRNGVIQSLGTASSSFVMTYGKKTATVVVGNNTKYSVKDVENASFANLSVGNKLHVRGVLNTKTMLLTASLVKVIPVSSTSTNR